MKYFLGKFFLILSFLSITNSTYPVKKWKVYCCDDSSDLLNGVVAVGCAVAAGIGIYKLCDWLFTDSDETILNNAQKACRDSESYDRYSSFLKHELSLGSKYSKRLINEVNESVLYQLATMMHKKDCIDSLISQMNSSLRSMKNAHKDLTKRMQKLLKKSDYAIQMTPFYKQMEQVQVCLEQAIEQLEFTCDYLATHKSYFLLFEQEASIMNLYERELHAIEACAGMSSMVLREELRVAVMKCANKDHTVYPYMQYIKRLQSNINELSRSMNNCSYHYSNRMSAAGHLLNKLKAINEMLIIEDTYLQELRDYEKARIEQEKAEAARRQAQALEHQAWQMQQQNWNLQRQNELKEKEIRVEKERNQLLWQQQFVPQQHVVHVIQ